MSGKLYEIDAMSMEEKRTLSTAPMKKMNKQGAQYEKKRKPWEKKSSMKHKMPPEKPTLGFSPILIYDFLYVGNNGTDNVVEIDVKKWKISRIFKTEKGLTTVK
ncbi:MAG: hypothetical protein CM1200mP1_13830 [Candidatus Neomarinimicrobiota bacterium]|nr:MAG: hypothetical protein CM1200mP1_13830 [Candidatus Neomarinimicrobiota bacterium]